jgi:alkylhydroperoxidase/carboxymuconolactone decarboxylase family protein YurZ
MKLIMNAVAAGISQYKRDLAARKRANPFRKRTITPLGFVSEVVSIAAEASTFNRVWVKREMNPSFRETLMLAVARRNDSIYCSWAHHEWAAIEGVSEKELAHIEQMDPAHFDRKTWLALSFVRELVTARFGPVPGKLMQQMRSNYTAEEVEQIMLVAKVMDAANRISNTFDALLSRLDGNASRTSGIVDEAIVSAALVAVLPPLLAYFSYASKRSIDELLCRMSAYTHKMDAEHAEAEGGSKRPARARKQPAQARNQPARVRKQAAQTRQVTQSPR